MTLPRCFDCKCYINSDAESPDAARCIDCFRELKLAKRKARSAPLDAAHLQPAAADNPPIP